MKHPLQDLPPGVHRRIFLPLLAATALVSAIMSAVGGPLVTSAAPSGIVSFELAGTAALARQMVASWNEMAKVHAGFSLGLDYLYMPLYSTTIALACLWAAGVFRAAAARVALVGMWLAWGLWLGALLDATENLALVTILFNGASDPWPLVSQVCAVGKFSLIIAGLVYAALGSLVWALQRARR
jgi:hypothetical protein